MMCVIIPKNGLILWFSWQDEGYEEFRALFTGLLDSDPSAPHSELSKRMQELAQPLVAKLGDAAAKLIQ